MKILVALSLLVLAFVPAKAQWGIEVGGSYNTQSGWYVAPCTCTFGQGTGIGYMGAVSFDLLSVGNLSIGIKPGYEFQYVKSYEVQPQTLARMADGHQEEISLGYLTIDPYLRYTIRPVGIFFQVAPGLNYIVSSSFHHIIPNPADTIGEDDPPTNPDSAVTIRSARYTAKISAGYDLPVGGLTLQPMVTVALPLTDLGIEKASEWRVTTMYVTVALRF